MLSKHYNRRPGKDPDKRPILCLTFDDGPDPVFTPQLLDLLDHWQILAAFFVVGRQAAAHPDLLRRMEASGHTVGLHSHTHKSAYLMSPRQTAKDFCQSVEALRTAGLHPKYYRPPWGHATPASRRSALGSIAPDPASEDSLSAAPVRINSRRRISSSVMEAFQSCAITSQ